MRYTNSALLSSQFHIRPYGLLDSIIKTLILIEIIFAMFIAYKYIKRDIMYSFFSSEMNGLKTQSAAIFLLKNIYFSYLREFILNNVVVLRGDSSINYGLISNVQRKFVSLQESTNNPFVSYSITISIND